MTGPAGFVAALDPAGWWVPELADPVPFDSLPASSPEQILDTAVRIDARQVWIYPGCREAFEWAGLDYWSTTISAASWGGPIWIWAKRHRDGMAVEISFLHDDPARHKWAGLDPPRLLAQIDAFSDALGARWSASGAITSDRWLRAHYRAPGGLRLAASDAPDVKVSSTGPAGMRHWARPLGPAEAGHVWVHAFDVNAMFLAAASSLALPVGQAHHLDRPAPTPKVPGWWRLEGIDEWIPSPTLELLLQRDVDGRLVDVAEAWTWPEHHRWLEPWYRALRIARGRLEPGTVAAGALKQVYSAGVARLGSLKRASGATDPLYQPYWGAAVRAEANARLERKLHRVRDHHGRAPFALDVDCTYWTADDPDPVSFAASVGLDLDDQLGHFKHAGTWPAAALDPAATTCAQIVAHLREGVNA